MVLLMHTWQMLLDLIVINDGRMDIGGSCITFLDTMIILLDQKELNVRLACSLYFCGSDSSKDFIHILDV
jgi:hypothetical protein